MPNGPPHQLPEATQFQKYAKKLAALADLQAMAIFCIITASRCTLMIYAMTNLQVLMGIASIGYYD